MKRFAAHIFSLALAVAFVVAPGHAQKDKDKKGSAANMGGHGRGPYRTRGAA